MASWNQQRLEAIRTCLNSGFVEEALVLLYSEIDTLAFLDSPAGTKDVKSCHFVDWCDRYIVPLLKPFVITGNDLYGARCGLLHTSSAASRMGREEDEEKPQAREIYYEFQGRRAVNLMANTPRQCLVLDVEKLFCALGQASQNFCREIKEDPSRWATAQGRIKQFFIWGLGLP